MRPGKAYPAAQEKSEPVVHQESPVDQQCRCLDQQATPDSISANGKVRLMGAADQAPPAGNVGKAQGPRIAQIKAYRLCKHAGKFIPASTLQEKSIQHTPR
ncbi:hypothetical protein AVEN_233141-1 [Araneus ventricosus]|uniref:Uncharacterized protein n=1 Tax=Araneus ventricosus TaxID=182803 RepID=A0A4Y2QFF3_ARAVE|nr:hypothetical protein AVEN_233141-1 [Araneus ventricosus]